MSVRLRFSPASSATMPSMARRTCGGGAASVAAGWRRCTRARVAAASCSGSCTPRMPRAVQTMPQAPSAVSKMAKCWAVMGPILGRRRRTATRLLVRRHRNAQRLGDRPRPAAGDEGDLDMRLDDQVMAAHHLLVQHYGSALHLLRRGDDVEHVVHVRRLVEVDVHVAHHEGEARRFGRGLLEQRAVVGADQAQIIGAAALHEAQVAGVIDDAGKIRVLVIDAHLLVVAAAADFAVERAHRHGTLPPIASSQCWPSNVLTDSAARSMPSMQRTLTSILSGSERGT